VRAARFAQRLSFYHKKELILAKPLKKLRVGFISTRIAGTDGVSLEIEKWAKVLKSLNCTCYYFAGELDRPKARSYLHKKAHFMDPDMLRLHSNLFGKRMRSEFETDRILEIARKLKKHLYRFIEKFKLDLIIPQNCLAIPVHVPLGIALTELIAETSIPTIAHHHDFFWERKRFLTNCVWDYLNMAFPPHLPAIRHVVINSSGDNQLSLRTGISATVIPNVMDFEKPPKKPDAYTRKIRKDLGIQDGEYFILQPTRVVQRKGIEHAIELVSRLNVKAKLVISHASGDEGDEYEERVRDYSKVMNVDTVFVSDIIGEKRGRTKGGRKIYTLQDIYPYADLVTYPSIFEGFGNAFLEAIYFKRPIIVNNYSIYATDIKPKGFMAIEFNDFITRETIRQVEYLLKNQKRVKRITDQNYCLARKYYSFAILKEKLNDLLVDHFGI
jgi:glycosyltransferase involved in cell wall biosynthesis